MIIPGVHMGDNTRCAQVAASCTSIVHLVFDGHIAKNRLKLKFKFKFKINSMCLPHWITEQYVLCLASGSEALSCEQRVLNNTNGQIQKKVAMTKSLPVADW